MVFIQLFENSNCSFLALTNVILWFFLAGLLLIVTCQHGGYRYTGRKMFDNIFKCSGKLLIFLLQTVSVHLAYL